MSKVCTRLKILKKVHIGLQKKNFNTCVCIFLQKFSTEDILVKLRLFSLFFCPCIDWNWLQIRRDVLQILENLFVLYHYALENVLGFLKYFSNHYTRIYQDTLVFGHLRNYILTNFYHWLSKRKSSCSIRHRVNLISFSSFSRYMRNDVCSIYGIADILGNFAVFSKLMLFSSSWIF